MNALECARGMCAMRCDDNQDLIGFFVEAQGPHLPEGSMRGLASVALDSRSRCGNNQGE